jgi:hypothetical protein
MKRRTTLQTIGGIVGTGVLAPGLVSADETWAREETKRFLTHQEVQDFLEDIDRRARTRYELEEIGESLEGRVLTVARVGEGDTDVFFTAEQHGDEPTGTNAILAELRELATSGTPFARQVREALTVHILPMHNPDGAMRNQRTNADGVDPNRQHHYEVGAGDNPSPETQAMIDYVVPLEPLWVADLHTQSGMYHDENENPGDMYHSSNFWPIAPEADPEAVELSQQLNVSMWDHAEGKANAQLSRYPGGEGTNIARNAYGVRGFGSILNEMTGQTWDRGERMEGQMVRIMRNENRGILQDTADGTLSDRDPDRVGEIPDRGARGDWPWWGGESTTE